MRDEEMGSKERRWGGREMKEGGCSWQRNNFHPRNLLGVQHSPAGAWRSLGSVMRSGDLWVDISKESGLGGEPSIKETALRIWKADLF
eukprot:1156039-Pelagomonas_calceolata.AAC.6